MLQSFYLLLLIIGSLLLTECSNSRHRSSLSRYSSQLSSLVQPSSEAAIASSASCFNPSGSLYDAIQVLPDTMIVAQFLKMDEFKHLAEIIQNPDAGLTFLVPTDESIYNTLSLHYNRTCKASNPLFDEMIAQVGDKTIECKKLDLMVRMTGLMAAMGKKMKSLHKKAFPAPMMVKPSQQQPLKSKEASPCPVNAPCPAGSSISGGTSQLVAAPIESAPTPTGGPAKHLLCSSPSLRRDALLKLCDQLGVRPDDFNLTFSAIDISVSTANFLYSLIQGTQTTNQFSPINIFPTLLDDPALVRLNVTDPTKNKQMIVIQASDERSDRYRVVYGIPSNDYSWYSQIIRPNLRTANGVLHVIDGPLHAPANPIFSLAYAKFDDFLSMALESGLAPMLGNRPSTTLFVPVESATKIIKKAFGFPSDEATFQSMLKHELIAQLDDILAMEKLQRYSMPGARTIGEERIVATQPLAMKLMQKARTTISDAFSLPQVEKHSMLATKFEEMAHHEKEAKLMARNASVPGFPAAYDPSQYWNYNYLQNLDQLRQIAQQFIAECVSRFGAEGGRPSIYINPRSSTGVIPEETPATPSRPSIAPLYSQTHRPRFGMPMMKSKDGSIEVPMQGWQYRLNRPGLIKGHVMAAVDHLFAHEKILSQPLFDNWNKTQTYADFINLHAFDGVFYTTNFEDGLTLQSMQGQLFSIKNSTEGVFGGVGDNWKIDQSNIIFPNIITSNGVIHIIDQPLGINLLPTNIIRQLLQESPVLRSTLTEKPTSRGLLGLLGPCPSPALKSLKAKAFPAKKKAITPSMPVKRDDDDDFDLFDFDDYDFDFDFDDDDDDYFIPSTLTSDQQVTMITIRSITEIIAKIAPRRGDEMVTVCGEELPTLPPRPSIITTTPPLAEKKDVSAPTRPTTIPAIPAGKVDITPKVDVKPSVIPTPVPGPQPTPVPAPAPLAPTPTPAEVKCPPLDQICVVNDPMLYSSPRPICYNPKTHLCVNNNFLCPHTAPNACGRACFDQAIYSCEAVKEQPFLSKLLLRKEVEAELKKKAKEVKPKEIPAKVPEMKPAEPEKLKPILDALAQMKLKPTQPKVQPEPSTKPILDVLEQMKAKPAPPVQQKIETPSSLNPILDALDQMKGKQTPPVQQKVQAPPSSKPIIDVLTDPALLQTSPQPAKVAKASPQPVLSQQPIKVNVTKARN